LPSSFFQIEKKKKPKKKKKKKKKRRELSFKLLLYPFIFGSHVCPPTFALLLRFLLASSSFQEKKNKEKAIEKKKYAEKGGSFLLSSRFAFSLLAPTSTLPLLPFCFKRFLLASFSSQVEKKKTKQRKKKP